MAGGSWQSLALSVLALAAISLVFLPSANAQQSPAAAATAEKERVEADISTRTVALGGDFSGSEVVIFGTVENSRQKTANDGLYDIAVVIEGPGETLTSWKKSNAVGIWVNTTSLTFEEVPSYYAVLSTRAIEAIAPKPVLYQQGIGFEYLRMAPTTNLKQRELGEFRQAVIRLKQQQNLYQQEENGVGFIGRSLFRATLTLPATVTAGEFTAWVYLFKRGELLSTYKTRLDLQRAGFEQLVWTIAWRFPLLYGIASVAIAMIAGLIASALFRKP